jgi:REP element-mobilizing transposase RayT
MGTFLRIHKPEYVHFITNRCEHQMYFILPQKEINSIILAWLTKSKELYGKDIEIYGFSFLSNHFHMLLKDPKGQLAQFMCYFQSNVARAVNRHLNRSGRFWSREYDDVIVDGEDEFWKRFSYTVLNPVKSGLVATPNQWSGISSYSYLMANKKITAISFDLTAYNEAARHNRKADPKDFKREFSFKLAIPPMLKNKTQTNRLLFLKKLFQSSMSKYKKDRLYKKALGMKKVKAQSYFDHPVNSKSSPRFKFMSFNQKRKKELMKNYIQFVNSYKLLIQKLSDHFTFAETTHSITHHKKFIWPEGSYPPSSHRPAGCI